MTRFLSIGECMVEFAPDEGGLYRSGFAGDTFNTAWYMRQLCHPGTEVLYHSAIGDDAASAEMTGFVREAGIGFDPLVIPGASVGLYMISLLEGERSFSYWRSASAARRLAEGLEACPALSPGDILFFSGITMAILHPETRAPFLDFVSKARANGITVAFDPNLRPRLWADGAEMCDWITRSAEVADVLLPSFDDEATHFGDTAPQGTVTRYRALGAATVVVKNGGGDVLVQSDGHAPVHVSPPKVMQVVDSTAAGDAFNAGFLSRWMRKAPLREAVEVGCNVSAQVIRQRGALTRISL
ncbi:sugar kinase [Pseudooceanicola atlanticus]|uniref:Carbohydrate kinase PfkB domain-containing protein n=1 Tax=Pseudooceanicola atlanticus TaxID=1461694 RepID=A0A0A0ECI9_9RHOB|nr:sugar kinase [Pseudooceanicola atlanticus]KGM48159.1 hypothetical protein ATO9_14380 [Pseudooceanicola atlanticus]